MVLDQGQGQLTDLAHQGFETVILLDPCLNLREEVLGDVDGARFASNFEGEVVGGMEGALVVAAAGRLATAFMDEREAGGEQGAVGGQPLEPGLEHAADLGRVLGNAHRTLRTY